MQSASQGMELPPVSHSSPPAGAGAFVFSGFQWPSGQAGAVQFESQVGVFCAMLSGRPVPSSQVSPAAPLMNRSPQMAKEQSVSQRAVLMPPASQSSS